LTTAARKMDPYQGENKSTHPENGIQYCTVQFPVRIVSVKKSKSLISLGVFQINVSLALFAWCGWLACYSSGNLSAAGAGMACAIFHIFQSVAAMQGGRNIELHRRYVLANLLFGIAGFFFVVAAMLTDVDAWQNSAGCNKEECVEDENSQFRCVKLCNDPPDFLYICILIGCIAQATVASALSGISCCYLFNCCVSATATSGKVIQQEERGPLSPVVYSRQWFGYGTQVSQCEEEPHSSDTDLLVH